MKSAVEMNKELFMKDVIQWDIYTWRRAIDFWREKLEKARGGRNDFKILDIGARDGGTSLLFARLGLDCVCSDFNGPTQNAYALHKKYNVSAGITYEKIDCTDIDYADDTFDAVAFKSVLGSIGSGRNTAAVEKAVSELYRVLKPGGLLLFAENMAGSALHIFLRKHFRQWGSRWFYIPLPWMTPLLARFRSKEIYTAGFLACFLNNNPILAKIDDVLCCKKPSKNHYMAYGCAVK